LRGVTGAVFGSVVAMGGWRFCAVKEETLDGASFAILAD
jgi:hypothetical protein